MRRLLCCLAVFASVTVSAQSSAPLFPQPISIPLPNTTPPSGMALQAPTNRLIAFAPLSGGTLPDVVYVTDAVAVSIGTGGGAAGGSGGIGSGTATVKTTVNVMLHNGTLAGSYTLPSPGCSGGGIEVKDLNNDGKLDVTLDCAPNEYVFFGRGNGTLTAPITYPQPAGTSVAYLADVNGDKLPDLITGGSNNGVGYVYVQLNQGSSLGMAVRYPISGYVNSVQTADVNGDGKQDIIVTGSHLSVLYGNGNGTFQPAVTLEETGRTTCLAVGDLNGDGLADIATCSTTSPDTMDIVFGNSSGALSIARSYPLLSSEAVPLAQGAFPNPGLAILPLTTGGPADVLFATSTVQSFLNDGQGNLSDALNPPLLSTDAGATVFTDWNGDGKLDVASVTSGPGENLLISEGDGTGNFAALAKASQLPPVLATGVYEVASGFANHVAAADFNNDGLMDFFTQGSNGVTVLLSNGDSTTTPVISRGPTGFGFVLDGDLNHDGNQDGLFLSVSTAGDVTVNACLGNGTGALACGTPQDLGTSGAVEGAWALADFTGDGYPDLLFSISGSSTTYYFARGLGNGNFAAPVVETLSTGNFQFSAGFFAVDLNHDGKADIIPAYPTGFALLSNGDGTFTADTDFAVTGFPVLDVADATGDGIPDVITYNADPNAPGISIFPGDGTGNFPGNPITILLPSSVLPEFAPGQVAVGDLNGDGLPDILLPAPTGYEQTSGTFTTFIDQGYALVPVLNQGSNSFVLDPNGPYLVSEDVGFAGPPLLGRLNRNGGKALDVALEGGALLDTILNQTNPTPPVLAPTTTTVATSADPIDRGSSVTLTATVASTTGTPTGAVTIYSNGAAVISAPLHNGVATLKVSTANLGAGVYTLTANYGGDATHLPSISGAEVVSLEGKTAPTIAAFNISYGGTLTQDKTIHLSVGVYPAAGSGIPTGMVTFYVAGKPLAAPVALSGGLAYLTLNSGSAGGGTYKLTAVYSGDAQFSASTSQTLSYSLGNTTATTLTITPSSGPSGTKLTFSAHVVRTLTSGVPQGTVEFFYPEGAYDGFVSVPLDAGGNASTTVTVPAAPAGTYTITAYFLGGSKSFDIDSDASGTFQLTK